MCRSERMPLPFKNGMKRTRHVISLLIVAALANSAAGQPKSSRIIKLKDLQTVIQSPSEKIKVINFWATWCAPCIKELPLFERLHQTRADIEVTLVSLDLELDPNPEKVYNFIARRDIQSEVLLLDESDPNSWIDQIDKQWSGAIPATLIINTKTGQRKFVGRELQSGEIEKMIQEIL